MSDTLISLDNLTQYDALIKQYINGGTTLFESASGVNSGTLNLSGNLANFNFIDIIFTDGTRYYSSRVYNPSGKTTSIHRVVNNSSTQYLDSTMLTLNTTTITIGNSRQTVITNSVSSSNTRTLKITEIRGG